MMFLSCHQIAREFILARDSSSNLIFSEDSLSVDYVGTAYFDTKEAKELYREGILARFQEDYEGAESKLKAALKVEPDNYSLLAGLGNIYAYQNRLDTALEFYDKAAIVSDSLYPGVFLGISKVYAARDEFQKALAAVEYMAQIAKEEDILIQVMTYYQLTAIQIALEDCAGADLTFRRFEDLTKNDARFNALKNKLSNFLLACTANQLQGEYRDPETGELLATAETFLLETMPEEEKQWATVISTLKNNSLQKEMVVTKDLFRDYLYKDFYHNSDIADSGISGKRANTFFAVTELTSTKGRNKARIAYKIEIEEEYSNLEILEVIYSHPEENITEPEPFVSP